MRKTAKLKYAVIASKDAWMPGDEVPCATVAPLPHNPTPSEGQERSEDPDKNGIHPNPGNELQHHKTQDRLPLHKQPAAMLLDAPSRMNRSGHNLAHQRSRRHEARRRRHMPLERMTAPSAPFAQQGIVLETRARHGNAQTNV